MATKSVRIVSNTPLVDERGYDRSSVVVLHSDMHNVGSLNSFVSVLDATTTPAADLVFDHGSENGVADSSGPTLGVAKLSTRSGSAGTSGRIWISDRVAQNQPTLLAGHHEMMCEARVRLVVGNDPNVEFRVGFFPAHNDPDNALMAVMFFCKANQTTWKTAIHRYVGVEGGMPSYSLEFDTGIPVADWHVLKVEISKSGDRAVFYVDGRAVRVETVNIPTWQSIKAIRSSLNLAFDDNTIRTVNECMQAGVSFRTGAGLNPTGVWSLFCDWCTFKYYR